MPFHRILAVTLLCALPFASASAAEPSVPTVKWTVPWKKGTSLEYAAEDLTISDLDARERTRSTSVATVRITEATKNGFVQVWSWRDARFVVEEGDKAKEAAMREYAAGMQDITLEVQLDADANYASLRNLEQITPRLRKAMRPAVAASIETGLARIPDAAKREEARKTAMAQMEGFVDRMLAPGVLEVLLTRNIQWYNGLVGIDIEPDQDYQANVEIPNPVSGQPIPITVTFSVSVDKDDPDDLFVAFEQTIDRENAGAAVTAILQNLLGKPLPKDQKLELAVIDEGMFVVHRPTGTVEMFESTRTVRAGERSKVERHRLRLIDGEHEHEWRDEQEPAEPQG